MCHCNEYCLAEDSQDYKKEIDQEIEALSKATDAEFMMSISVAQYKELKQEISTLEKKLEKEIAVVDSILKIDNSPNNFVRLYTFVKKRQLERREK